MSFSPTLEMIEFMNECMIAVLNLNEKPVQKYEYECYTFDKYDPPKDHATSGNTQITINLKSPTPPTHSERLPYHLQKSNLAQQRLDTIGFQSRLETPADGDCFLHAFLDQMSMDSELPPEASNLTTVQIRTRVLESLIKSEYENLNYDGQWQWINQMRKPGTWCDHQFIQLTANLYKRNVILYPIYPEDGHSNTGQIMIEANESDGTFTMLYYANIHFQSIVPKQRPQNKMSCTKIPQTL